MLLVTNRRLWVVLLYFTLSRFLFPLLTCGAARYQKKTKKNTCWCWGQSQSFSPLQVRNKRRPIKHNSKRKALQILQTKQKFFRPLGAVGVWLMLGEMEWKGGFKLSLFFKHLAVIFYNIIEQQIDVTNVSWLETSLVKYPEWPGIHPFS